MRKLVMTLALLASPAVLHAAEADELLQPQFKFRHQEITLGTSLSESSTRSAASPASAGTTAANSSERHSLLGGKLNQFDATISYPFSPRDSVNLDLGVNLRFINGELSQQEASFGVPVEFNATLPMLYANALFDLPYEGLSASLGASHLVYDQYYALDYQAKLSYKWQNGLGLEGGWQHQHLSIDGGDIQADIESKGPFLDLKYRF